MNFLNKCFKSPTFNIFGFLTLTLAICVTSSFLHFIMNCSNGECGAGMAYFIVLTMLAPYIVAIFICLLTFEKIFKWEIKSNTLTKNILYKIFTTIGMIIFLIYTIGISVTFIQSFFS